MSRKKRVILGLAIVLPTTLLFGCGVQAQDLTSKYMTVDQTNQTVTIKVIAGETSQDGYRNFNGFSNGGMTITVPVGYKVTFDYENASGIPADIGVYTKDRQLAFQGAGDSINDIFLNAVAGVLPGQSEKVTFTASQVGNYQIANYLDRFPQVGDTLDDYQSVDMWDNFDVVASGSPSVTAGQKGGSN